MIMVSVLGWLAELLMIMLKDGSRKDTQKMDIHINSLKDMDNAVHGIIRPKATIMKGLIGVRNNWSY